MIMELVTVGYASIFSLHIVSLRDQLKHQAPNPKPQGKTKSQTSKITAASLFGILEV
jgi:hypothetical protein